MCDVLNTKSWYLIRCKPKEGFRAALNRNHGYTCFHPTYPVQRKVAGTVRSTRGASMVCLNSVPATLETTLVENLQQHCAKLNSQVPAALLNPGDRVVISIELSVHAVEACA
ncbi:MAG: hypothetical protein A3F18_02665 [Legionellales bacterium RIFCSPHIGHO2_12_FULL_37_14]|nr:MAG: hypothetical protein A3F18_02665 [Legionellales bacterium RIFCSPHIGHO2_12_FULL_37_14]